MDPDRPHRSNSINSNNNNSSSVVSRSTTTTTSKLFICLASRLSSSSSMKISSKSILSPGRAREPSQISLSNSLSRRLRSNGSMKGGQASPMFPTATNGKKRGSAGFENPEPSSPKVTCIGQVRVKTKKQGKKMRTRSKRRSGEVSFRRLEPSNNNIDASSFQDCEQSSHFNHQFPSHHHQQPQECLSQRNQRWVHFPVSICEALRAFGAEFNCFLPCRSSCMASEKEKGEKAAGSTGSGSCGAVFSRWLVSVQEEDGKGREIELVVGEEAEDEEEEEREESRERRSYRRHVFEDIEFKDEKFEGGNGSVQEGEGRVTICTPPKNALLLMRCRSDPVRMAALANKFCEGPIPKDDDENDDEEEEDEDEEKEDDKAGKKDRNEEEEKGNAEEEDGESKIKQKLVDKESLICEHGSSCEVTDEHRIQEIEAIVDVLEVESGKDCQDKSTGGVGVQEESSVDQAEENETEVNPPIVAQEFPHDGCLLEETADPAGDLQQSSMENENEDKVIRENDLYHEQKQDLQLHRYEDQEDLQQHQYEDQELKPLRTEAVAELEVQGSMEGAEEERMTHDERHEPEDPKTREGQLGLEWTGRESQPLLPDCLLLMMCEPKLSMEVSKETWVCSTDFIRWLPQQHSRPVNKKDGKDEAEKRASIDSNPAAVHDNNLQQPPRSSCSYPAKPPARVPGTESMATVIEQRLVGGKAYEPFVLTRCKSEPMRSAAKLSPEACFWKNRKLEPHGPTTLGVGAAGVGF